MNHNNNEKCEVQRVYYGLMNSIKKNADFLWENMIEQIKYYDSFKGIPDEPFASLPKYYPLIQSDVKGEETGLPDIIYEGEKYVVGIEHFEFDASKRNKKGSQLRKEEAIAESKINKIIRSHATNERHYKINVDMNVSFTLQNYITSLLGVFRQHSENVKKYRNSMSEYYPQKEILLAFYIENVTRTGNYIKRNDVVIPLHPNRILGFLAELLKNPGIDYIISRVDNAFVPELYFLKNTSDSIMNEIKNACSVNDYFIALPYNIEASVWENKKDKN